MKRRIPRCRVLVGWRDPKTMKEPILCAKPARSAAETKTSAVGLCAEHVAWLAKKSLTVVVGTTSSRELDRFEIVARGSEVR